MIRILSFCLSAALLFSCQGISEETKIQASSELCTCMDEKSKEPGFKPDYAFAKCSRSIESKYNFEVILEEFQVHFSKSCPTWEKQFRQVIKNELRY